MKQAKDLVIRNTHSLTHWFTFSRKRKPKKNKAKQWKFDNLIHDPFSKKKRHKDKSDTQGKTKTKLQLSIKKFLNRRKRNKQDK